jgi:hypothetical protein
MPAPNTVMPIFLERENTYRIELGAVRFECTAANSGRITTFAFEDRNILTDASINPFNFGATFWTSPQKDWQWPPPREIDSDDGWEGRIEDGTIILAGPPCPDLGINVVKRFRADTTKQAVSVSYEMRNISSEPLTYAPWEISRVHPGGLTFFPTGEAAFPPTIQSPLPTEERDGVTWFHHTDATVTSEHKLFADGQEGWIAHLDGDLLFIKTFEDITPEAAAPTESEIEIYAIPSYVEVEQQGAYRPIAPGSSRTWTIHWYLVKGQNGSAFSIGNPDLVRWVRETIAHGQENL